MTCAQVGWLVLHLAALERLSIAGARPHGSLLSGLFLNGAIFYHSDNRCCRAAGETSVRVGPSWRTDEPRAPTGTFLRC
jgi:hypothetical protein